MSQSIISNPEDYFERGKLYSYINASPHKNFYGESIEAGSFYTKLKQHFFKKEFSAVAQSTYYEYDRGHGVYKTFSMGEENNTLMYLLSEYSGMCAGMCAGYVVYFWHIDKIIFSVYRPTARSYFLESFIKI